MTLRLGCLRFQPRLYGCKVIWSCRILKLALLRMTTMPKYKSFAGSNTSILIEVEEGSTGEGGGSFKDSLSVLPEIIRFFVDSVDKIPTKKKPKELKITFSLKTL